MQQRLETIDLSSSDAARLIDRACCDIGAFVLVGHGVPRQIVDGVWSAARAFFDLPLETKMRARVAGNPYGYEPMEHEALGRTPDEGAIDAQPDRKQTFNLGPPFRGPDTGFGSHQRIWPTEPYELRPNLLNYYSAMEQLSERLLSIFARVLGCDPTFFGPFTDAHLSALRILDYPMSPPGEVQVRAGAHTDYGMLTVLRPDHEVSGLEIADPSGTWIEVPRIEDGFVVNTGDLMHRWSNGRFRSALHRVVADPGGRRRNSVAFFHNPNWDARVEPVLTETGEVPAFEPVPAGPWLRSKVERAAT